VTRDVLQMFKVRYQRWRWEHENVVWSPSYCCSISETGVAESNGSILIGSSQLAVCACMRSTYLPKNSPDQLVRHRAAFKLRCIRSCHTCCSCCFF